jgi:hypothetical protein
MTVAIGASAPLAVCAVVSAAAVATPTGRPDRNTTAAG